VKNRNRLDHHVPQCYLEGFIGPSGNGQLSVFDKQKRRWFESGTPGAGAIKGFYDYSEGSVPDQTADGAFGELETTFPKVRRELIGGGFANWNKRLDTLLRFAQMLRVRTLLFREQALSRSRNLTFLKIEEILPPGPGESGTRIRYSHHAPSEGELLNKTITDMRMEIAGGAAWMSDLQWCLRTTAIVEGPFVTCDGPVVMEGRVHQAAHALKDSETLVFFPLCWQACLVGSPAKLDIETGALGPDDMKRLRALYFKSARRFVFSPLRTEFSGQLR
jgi:hypothetical protein